MENTLPNKTCVNPKTELKQMKFGSYSRDCLLLKEMLVLNPHDIRHISSSKIRGFGSKHAGISDTHQNI